MTLNIEELANGVRGVFKYVFNDNPLYIRVHGPKSWGGYPDFNAVFEKDWDMDIDSEFAEEIEMSLVVPEEMC